MEQQRKLSQSSGQPQQQYQSVQDSYWGGITSRILGLQRKHGQNVPSRLPNPIRRTSSQLMPTQNHHQPMFYSAGSSSAAAPQQTMSENRVRPYNLRPQLSDIPMFGQEIQEPLYKKQRFPQMSSLSSLPSVSQEAIWQQLEQPVQQQLEQQMQQQAQQQVLQQAQQQVLQQAQQQMQQQKQQMQQQAQQQVLQRAQQQVLQQTQQQVQQQVQQHVHMDIHQPVEPDQGFVYVPGMCARRLVSYTLKMQERPTDNNIEFWRDLVSDYFAPDAKKRWCVSQYRKKLSGIPEQDTWNCGICKVKPGRGFEVTPDVLPRLSKMKYDNGAIKERYLLEMPNEYKTASGLIVLQCAKATHETVLKKVRVVREGQLCIVFTPDLKICSWEFCGHHHDEVVQKQDLIPQASDLIITTGKEYEDARNRLKSPAQGPQTSSKFANSANQSAKAARTFVHEVGYEKQYIRGLQTSEVLNSMKDIMKHSKITGSSPKESMVNFTSGFNMSYGNNRNSGQQLQEQQQQAQPHSGFTFIQNPSSAVSFQPSTWNDNQMTMSYFPANGDPIHQVYFTGLPTTSVMAQPNHSFAMAPSSSNIPPKVDHSGDQQGGAPSLASFAPKKLRIHPHISTMPVDSTLEAEFNGSPKSLVKIFEQVLKNSQLSGATTAGLEGVGNADNNLNNGNAEIKMDNNNKGKDVIIDSNPAIPDDFEQQLLFFVEGEDAFNNLDFL